MPDLTPKAEPVVYGFLLIALALALVALWAGVDVDAVEAAGGVVVLLAGAAGIRSKVSPAS